MKNANQNVRPRRKKSPQAPKWKLFSIIALSLFSAGLVAASVQYLQKSNLPAPKVKRAEQPWFQSVMKTETPVSSSASTSPSNRSKQQPIPSKNPSNNQIADIPYQNISLRRERKTQILVSPKDVKSYPLITVTPQDIARPNRLVCHKEVCYYLARGQLYQFEAQQLKHWQPPQPLIQSRKFKLKTGETIRELSDLTINAQGHVFLLDKSNDIYRYEPSSQAWRMEWKSAPYHKQPDPHFISLQHFNGKSYILDYARNQIWRYHKGEAPSFFFPREVMSWEIKAGDHQVVDGIDMHVDGDVYVLSRQGAIHRYRSGKIIGQPWIDLQNFPRPLQQPFAFRALRGDAKALYVVDAGNQQVFQIEKQTRQIIRHWIMADNDLEWHQLHDIAFLQGRVLLLAGSQMLELPTDTPHERLSLQYQNIHPVDQVLQHFKKPIATAQLPDNAAIYPGARRLYRHGIHEGADFFDVNNPQGGGRQVRFGSEVTAIQGGRVLRGSEHPFREMTAHERSQALQESAQTHETSRENEERFRGRQVWIEHDGGVVSVYAHLSAIPPHIQKDAVVQQGDFIGNVGNSGTSDGVRGTRNNPHLHLEIWLSNFDNPIDGEYLGKWLSLPETRSIWERVFGTSR